MPKIKIILDVDDQDGDQSWRENIDPTNRCEIVAATRVARGMASGASAAAFIIQDSTGKRLYAETSMEVFLTVATAFAKTEQMEESP